jgi:hypothetical protein
MPLELIDREMAGSLTPEKIEELFTDLRKATENDPVLTEYRENAKPLEEPQRPAYTPTVTFEYKLTAA